MCTHRVSFSHINYITSGDTLWRFGHDPNCNWWLHIARKYKKNTEKQMRVDLFVFEMV